MKKLGYALLFLLSLVFFLYLNFPFERFIQARLCQRGITASELEFKRFPPEVILKEVKLPGLPFRIETLTVKPHIPLKKFDYLARMCGGKVWGSFTYPVTEVVFHLQGIKPETCYRTRVRLKGELSGEGFFRLKEKNLTAGQGSLKGEKLELEGFSFGLFQAELLSLGTFKGSYSVEGKNLIEFKGRGSGKDADYWLSGTVNYNPKKPTASYVNLKITVLVKKEPLKGKRFTFKLRGLAENLRLW